MPLKAISEILDWSADRPAWQRDALRRLFIKTSLTATDVNELAEICKTAHGLSSDHLSQPLSAADVPVVSAVSGDVSLLSVTHHQGVNALASNQTVAFGPGLTVVYGENAAGKSGYIRILKQACRARAPEDILGNVLDGTAPASPHATIRMKSGSTEASVDWTPTGPRSDMLASVTVFDAHCVPVYLEEKTDVVFRPFGLDIFDRLAGLCGDVRGVLEKERQLVSTTPFVPPTLPPGSTAKNLVDSLTALTSVDAIRQLASLSEADLARLGELEAQKADALAGDPKALRRELSLKADRFSSLAAHIETIEHTLSAESLQTITEARQKLLAAGTAVRQLQEATLTGTLPGTGGPAWRLFWDAARKFADAAYVNGTFPGEVEDLCLFCQQPLGEEGASRLRQFGTYAASTAQAELKSAEDLLARSTLPISSLVVDRQDLETNLTEIEAEASELQKALRNMLAKAKDVRADVIAAVEGSSDLPEPLQTSGYAASIRQIAMIFRDRADRLKSGIPGLDVALQKELDELSGRKVLRDHLGSIEAEIERRKRLNAYSACIAETSTTSITKKSTELTKELITDALRAAFQSELQAIGFTHTQVELRPVGGTKGVLRHQLAFAHAPGVPVAKVLSEGESRALSLAAFLTELSTAPAKSAIIFDDPVSSLDHVWRDKIARRLAREGSRRQVIVFTHDLLFWHRLRSEADAAGVPLSLQYVRREAQAGMCLPDVPWFAMSTKERISYLKNRVQALHKTAKSGGPDEYERDAREIYGLLREAWEIAVGDVLLNGVVERYRPSIETQRARKLHDIEITDLEILESEMTECSRWIRGHAAAAADGTPIPKPDEVVGRIDTFEKWVKQIHSRR